MTDPMPGPRAAGGVLVTHPGRQHSHQTALALAGAGMLAGYWAGVPALTRHRRGIPGPVWRRFVRYAPVALPEELVRWYPWTPALRRLGDLALPAPLAGRADFLACRAFDRWAARHLAESGAAAVVACEISALQTFARARELGLATILDAPSLHHRAQDRLHGFLETPELHRRIVEVKDREIELADHILTVSELARQTYVEAGVLPERVHAVTLGADGKLFAPAPGEEPAEHAGGFTFLFCGAAIHRKGFDLLLDAFAWVREAEPSARLVSIGPAGDAADRLGPPPPPGVTAVGPLPQADLATRFRQADCLVLPSRNDSYGMVVAEALAAGLPALVSDMVGSKDLVGEGRTGWVVPAGDAGALAERMLWCARHREAVRAMAPACRGAAAGATWPAHHRRLADLMRRLLGAAG